MNTKGMGESFMIKQKGFVCFNLQLYINRYFFNAQDICSSFHKLFNNIYVYPVYLRSCFIFYTKRGGCLWTICIRFCFLF